MAASAGGDPPPTPNPARSERVRPPRPPPPPKAHPSKIFCPYQPTFETIKVHVFDIGRGINGFLGTLDAVWRRRVRLSPFTVYGIPLTLLSNPKTEFSSHFIIRLIDSRKPRYEADLLFRDTDMYFVGFRRNLVLTEAEKAESEREKQEEELKRQEQEAGSSKKKKTKKEKKAELKGKKKQVAGWGQWYRFSEHEMVLPEFFNAKSCEIPAGYSDAQYATLGGPKVFEHMLEAFGTFQDDRVSKSQLSTATQRVIIMFSEAVRLRPVWNMVKERLLKETSPCEIPSHMWSIFRDWDVLGKVVLQARQDGSLDLTSPLPEWCSNKHPKLKLSTYSDLIGPQGVIRVINRQEDYMGYTTTELENMREQARRSTGPGSRETRF